MASSDITEILTASPDTSVGVGLPDFPNQLILGRYQLRSQLGAGGFGLVWEGYDRQLRRLVAVKQIKGSPRRLARAEREARAVACLSHPNVTQLYEFVTEGDSIYLISELVQGRTLADLMEGGALSDHDIARVGIGVLKALAHAHERGVVHRDVKPQNIIVVDDPEAYPAVAKLMDFGVAQLVAQEPITLTGDVVGTLAYMAPEQAAGARVDYRADVYAMALTAYEALSGENPGRSQGAVDTVRRIQRRVPTLRRWRRDLPQELTEAIDQALSVRPENRPGIDELRTAFEECLDKLDDQNSLISKEGRQYPLAGIMPRPPAWMQRLGHAGLITALLALAATSSGGQLPLPAALIAAIGGSIALAAPRLGWIAAVVAAVAWYGSADVNQSGLALVIGVAGALPVAMMPRAKFLWTLPALAPILGLVGLGPAYLAIAGLARGTLRRAALGALGMVWLSLTEIVTQRSMFGGPPPGAAGYQIWQSSIADAWSLALWPLLADKVVLMALLWGLFAVVFPLIVRGRAFVLDLLAVVVWAAAFSVVGTVVLDQIGRSESVAAQRGAVAMAVVVLAGLAFSRVIRELGVLRPARGGTSF